MSHRCPEKFLHGRGAEALFLVFFIFAVSLPPTEGAEVKPEWRVRWDAILEAAEKEGHVAIYGSEDYERVFQGFQKKFPDIKATFVLGPGGQIGQRIMSERRAGRYLADLYVGGSGTAHDVLHKANVFDPIRPALILPEVVDTSRWWRQKHYYVDQQGEYILAFNGEVQAYFGYNTRLVNPKEFRSYWDFVNPRWRGKIVAIDPSSGGGVTGVLRFLYHTPGLGPQFLRRFLGEMDLTATRDLRQITDWLASGKFAISALAGRRIGLDEAKRQGLPVDWFHPGSFKEGAPLSTSNGNAGLISGSPHPNAAKAALNWLLSREGQIAYQTIVVGSDSLRIDIPKNSVPAYKRRLEKAQYEMIDNPETRDLEIVLQLVKQVWGKKR